MAFTIDQLGQRLLTATASPSSITFGGETSVLSTSGGDGTGAVSYSIESGLCTVSGTTLTATGVGTCSVTATKAADTNYKTRTSSAITVTVNQASQAITFAKPADQTFSPGGSLALAATGGASGNPVTFASTTTGVCTTGGANGATVTVVAAGTCSVTASQAGSANYAAATDVSQSFAIGKASQAITFAKPADQTFTPGGTLALVATGGASGNPVTFASTTTGVCTTGGANGATVTFVAAGTCSVTASQAGSANYAAATDVSQSFAIGKASQAITFAKPADQTFAPGGTLALVATGGASGNPVTFASATTGVCTTGGSNGATVTFVAAGTCSVTASQAGSANYAAATDVSQSFAIGKASQTVAFTSTAPTNVVVGSASYTPAATGGASGNPVTFSIDVASTSGACAISGTVVSFTGAGSCVIDANQAGNANYLAAAQKQQTVTVGLQPTTTTLSASQTNVMVGQQITFMATVMTAQLGTGTAATASASARLAAAAAATPAPVTTGSVTFTNGSSVLCNAVTLNASGQATCTITVRSAGAMSVTASFSGSGSSASSSSIASAASSPVVTDQSVKTSQVIGKFLGQRNNQILTNGPNGQRQIDRLKEAGGQSGDVSSGLTDDVATPRSASSQRLGDAGAASVPARRFGGVGLGAALADRPVAAAIGIQASGNGERSSNDPSALFGQPTKSDFELANAPTSRFGGVPLGWNGAGVFSGDFFSGTTSVQFSTSLRDITRFAEAERAKSNGGLALATGRAMPNVARANPWDVWVEGQYASFRDTSGAAGAEGKFGLVTVGTDYVFSPSLLAGVMLQFDQTEETSAAQQSSIEGNGWMAGPYGTVRLSENLFWQGRAAWGTSSNSVSPFLTYTDKFASTRWLLASTLAGHWDLGPWSFRPSASVSYIEDNAQGYADTFGITMPEVKTALGQAKIGPEIGYKWRLSDDLILQPKAGVQLIWSFAGSSTANGVAIDGNAAGPTGVRGRGEVGIGLVHRSGITVDLSGSYDGIGSGGYSATTGKAMVRAPLN